MKDVVVEGLTTGPGGDVSITLVGLGPGCAAAYSDGLEETKCSKCKAENKLALTGAKVGRYCAAVPGVVTEATHIKATFVASAIKAKVDGSKAPLRKDDSAPGGSCSCTLVLPPNNPFAATFVGSIDGTKQTKVKAN